jgi:hypothetical protein
MDSITICGYKGCNNSVKNYACIRCIPIIFKNRESMRKNDYYGPFTYYFIKGGLSNITFADNNK